MEETFCEAESVIKPCLKILANLLHGGKQAVDKAEQIPLSYNEYSMHYKYCHVGRTFTTQGWMGINRWQGWTKPKKFKKHWIKVQLPAFISSYG